MSDHAAERRLRTLHGIPEHANWTWWWRARHVRNCPERAALEAYTADLAEIHRPAVLALRRRLSFRSVGA